ncbi:hypothetical protein D9M71_393810 [compost metagenome]
MAEAPLPERVFEIDEFLGQLIEVPITRRILVDHAPGGFDRGVMLRRAGWVTLETLRVDRQPGVGHQANRFVIQRRRGDGFFQFLQQLRPMGVGAQQRRALVTQDELDFTVLERLEARRLPQERPDRVVLGGRHGGQYRPRMHQLIKDSRDPRQHLEGRRQLTQPNVFAGGLELVQHQLHPQLGGLVLDDEQHLVMVRRQRVLGAENTPQVQVVAVAHGVGKIQLGVMPFICLIGRRIRTLAH